MKTIINIKTIWMLFVLIGLSTKSFCQTIDTTLIINGHPVIVDYDKSWTEQKKVAHFAMVRQQHQSGSRTDQDVKTLLANIPVTPECSNGDFENGFTDWTGFTICHNPGGLPIEDGLSSNGCNGSGLGFSASNAYGDHLFQVQTPGLDPLLAFSTPSFNMNKVLGGASSVRLGNNNSGYAAEGLAKRFVVTPANARMYFQYAIVMDKSHSNPDGSMNGSEAFFMAEAYDNAGTSIDKIIEVANPGNPFISSTNNGRKFYRDWRCVYLDLSSHIGQVVTVYFLNADCAAGGHRGYTYLDDVCVPCQSNEGSISIDLSGEDCIDFPFFVNGTYTLPNKPGIRNVRVRLHVLQNGIIINSKFIIPSGGTFSFTLNESDLLGNSCIDLLAELEFELPDMAGVYQKVKEYSSKWVNGVNAGIYSGQNNDFCYCCCTNELVLHTANGTTPSVHLPVNHPAWPITGATVASETFTVNTASSSPITEMRFSVVHSKITSNYDDCLDCYTYPVLLGSIDGPGRIGPGANSLVKQPDPYYALSTVHPVHKNRRELVYSNPDGTYLAYNDQFILNYFFPEASNVPCCAEKAEICIKITYTDLNCETCEIFFCREIPLQSPNGSTGSFLGSDIDIPTIFK